MGVGSTDLPAAQMYQNSFKQNTSQTKEDKHESVPLSF
jgi:hypothetical protein